MDEFLHMVRSQSADDDLEVDQKAEHAEDRSHDGYEGLVGEVERVALLHDPFVDVVVDRPDRDETLAYRVEQTIGHEPASQQF